MSELIVWITWATAAAAQAALAAVGTPLTLRGDVLHHANGFAAHVNFDCTACWPALLLSLALVLSRRLPPGTFMLPRVRRLPAATIALGVAAMVAVNQLRLVAVVWIGVHAPAHFGWLHEIAGPLLLVAAGLAFVVLAARPSRRGQSIQASQSARA